MPENKNKLVVLWTSGDKEIAFKMVFMYTLNAKLRGWWKEVTLIAWGPSTKLLSEDVGVQAYYKKIKDSGVELLACRACTDEYGVTKTVEDLGAAVIYMGEPLTEYLKNDIKLITF